MRYYCEHCEGVGLEREAGDRVVPCSVCKGDRRVSVPRTRASEGRVLPVPVRPESVLLPVCGACSKRHTPNGTRVFVVDGLEVIIDCTVPANLFPDGLELDVAVVPRASEGRAL